MAYMIEATPMRFGLRERLTEARTALNDAAHQYKNAKTPTEIRAATQKVHVARSHYLDVRAEVTQYRQEMKVLDEKDQYEDWKRTRANTAR